MTAYARVKNLALDIREEMESSVEPSVCRGNVRARYELQVKRYGNKLSQCLIVTNG